MKYIIESDNRTMRFLCQRQSIQWWGDDHVYAKRFTSRAKAQDLCDAIRKSTTWAKQSNLRVSVVKTGEVVEQL